MLVKMRKSNIYKKLTIILVNTNTNNDDILDLDNRKISKLEKYQEERKGGTNSSVREDRKKDTRKGIRKRYICIYTRKY